MSLNRNGSEDEKKSLEEKLHMEAVAEKIFRLKNNLLNLFGDNISDSDLDAHLLAKIEENRFKTIKEALSHFTTRDLFIAREIIAPKPKVIRERDRGVLNGKPVRIK